MFKLKLRDWLKGLIMAVGTPVLYLLQELIPGWNIPPLAQAAISATITYLLKNLFTDDVKAATKVIKSESDGEDEDPLIIIPVTELPTTGARGVWYFYDGEYYYWSNQSSSFISIGGDRPTKPPHNP